jgi:hypothetical protein
VNIDVEKRRIGVAPVPEGSARADAALGDELSSINQPVEGFGSLADKLRDVLKRKT